MARSRNIKPGFFTNDLLGEMDPLARLLFAGLWTLCDREGRVEDRPKKIKAEVLPYDNCDPEILLQQLADKGFILRYKAGSVAAIQVLAWEKHQHPHQKEGASTIPAPDKHGASTRQAPESTGQAPDETGTSPECIPAIPALARLIPDSLSLDSLSSDSLTPPTPSRGFGVFWESWPNTPRKVAKKQCAAKWDSQGCEAIADEVLAALDAQKRSEQWTKEGGAFVPSPLVWLNQRRWEAPKPLERVDASVATYDYLREQKEHAAQRTKPPAELLALIGKAVKTA